MKKRREALARQNFPGAAAVRHEQMLDAAAKHLNASGVSLTSLSDIAVSLGVSRATLYQYIEDREDLVFQCYRRSCEVMARHLGEAIRLGTDAAEVISIFVDRMLDPDRPETATRAEIESIRGVDVSGVLESLVERRLARIAGRRDVPGRPLVYVTTQEFLETFGLRDLKSLPTLAELGDDIRAMAEQSAFGEGEERNAAVLPLEEGEAISGDEERAARTVERADQADRESESEDGQSVASRPAERQGEAEAEA